MLVLVPAPSRDQGSSAYDGSRAPGRAVVAGVVVVVGAHYSLRATCAQPVCPRQAVAAQSRSEGGWWQAAQPGEHAAGAQPPPGAARVRGGGEGGGPGDQDPWGPQPAGWVLPAGLQVQWLERGEGVLRVARPT